MPFPEQVFYFVDVCYIEQTIVRLGPKRTRSALGLRCASIPISVSVPPSKQTNNKNDLKDEDEEFIVAEQQRDQLVR